MLKSCPLKSMGLKMLTFSWTLLCAVCFLGTLNPMYVYLEASRMECSGDLLLSKCVL